MTDDTTTIWVKWFGQGDTYRQFTYRFVLTDGNPRHVVTPENWIVSLTYKGDYNAPIARFVGWF